MSAINQPKEGDKLYQVWFESRNYFAERKIWARNMCAAFLDAREALTIQLAGSVHVDCVTDCVEFHGKEIEP
jgi:hypothetical protein